MVYRISSNKRRQQTRRGVNIMTSGAVSGVGPEIVKCYRGSTGAGQQHGAAATGSNHQ